MAGNRSISDGSLNSGGTVGYYWSYSFSSNLSRYLHFNSSSANMVATMRGYGYSVRCLKD
jgi:hypothetical protein